MTEDPTGVRNYLFYDAAGRISWSRNAIRGTVFVPLADGLSIVRAGTHVRRIVH